MVLLTSRMRDMKSRALEMNWQHFWTTKRVLFMIYDKCLAIGLYEKYSYKIYGLSFMNLMNKSLEDLDQEDAFY